MHNGEPLGPNPDAADRLESWFAGQLPEARDVRIEGMSSVDIGHSAETLILTVAWWAQGIEHRREVALRLEPKAPGLLPPYDLERQFTILRALDKTPVLAPRALWFGADNEVLGRPFYVMERAAGTVYEQSVPDGIEADQPRLRRMCLAIIEQLAAIHLVDLPSTGLDALGDGRDYLDQQLQHWESEIRRLQRGPLPALERLVESLRESQPAPCQRVTLVHGDPKPGNVAFVGAEVTAVFDWELATVGDPLADVGWLELLWGFPVGLPSVPGAPTVDELLVHYESLTGIVVQHRPWYRAFQALKMAVIDLSASMLFDSGASDDPRFAQLGYVVHWMTRGALRELGVDPNLDSGPVTPRPERIAAVPAAAAAVAGFIVT